MVNNHTYNPFIDGISLLRGLTNWGYEPVTKWDDPPSSSIVIAEGEYYGIVTM